MEINLLEPHGYCYGVKRALETVINTLNNPNTKKPIYLLGNLIHNKYVTKKLESLGIITIDSNGRTRLEMLDDIKFGTVIFSAHGVSDDVVNKAREKNLDIVDATCPNVLQIHKRIKNHLLNNDKVIYIGTKTHPECEGVLGLSKDIILYDENLDLTKFKNDNVYVTNQTTLSNLDLKETFENISKILPNAIIDNKICLATTKRQEALINQNADLCIVVGDTLSSNSKKLKLVSEKYGNTKAILVESADDLVKYNFKNYKKINITSGASTPEEITLSVIEKLKKES